MTDQNFTLAVRPGGPDLTPGTLLYDSHGRLVAWVESISGTRYQVVIEERGERVIQLIKEIRGITGLSLGDAKAVSDRAATGDSAVAVFDTHDEASKAAKTLTSIEGVHVRIENVK